MPLSKYTCSLKRNNNIEYAMFIKNLRHVIKENKWNEIKQNAAAPSICHAALWTERGRQQFYTTFPLDFLLAYFTVLNVGWGQSFSCINVLLQVNMPVFMQMCVNHYFVHVYGYVRIYYIFIYINITQRLRRFVYQRWNQQRVYADIEINEFAHVWQV